MLRNPPALETFGPESCRPTTVHRKQPAKSKCLMSKASNTVYPGDKPGARNISLTLVKAAVHPAGSHPPSTERAGSKRSAVTVTVPIVPISFAENSCSGEGTVAGVGGVATGEKTGAGVVVVGLGGGEVSDSTMISV